MSDRDTSDDESSDDLWDEVEEFAEADPDEAEEFVEVEEVTDVGTDHSPVENGVTERNGAAVDEGIPNTEDTPDADESLPNTEDAPDADEVFDEMDISAVDGEALWEELAEAETQAGSFDGEGSAGVEAEPGGGQIDAEPAEPSVGMDDGRSTGGSDSNRDTETLVDKRAYCQQCPYFSAPPEVSCSHDGTEIVEVLKDGRFRVTNCPVVTETGPDRTILNDGS